MKKKRDKKTRSFDSKLISESIYIKQLLTLPDKEKTYKAFSFLENVRNDSEYNLNKKTSYFFKDKILRDIILCNMKNRKDRISVDYILKSRGVVKDLDWASEVIFYHSKELNDFIRLRDNFNKFYMLGENQKAKEITVETKRLYGMSVWQVQAELLVARSLGDSKTILNYLNENPVKNESSESFISTEVLKIDPNVSSTRFKFSFESNMEELKNNGASAPAEVAEFLHMYSPDIKIDNPGNYVTNFQMMPIVDYYYYCIRLLKHLVFNNENDLILPFLSKISSVISDADLSFLCYKSGLLEYDGVFDSNLVFINACKDYENGNYLKCLEKMKALILEDPTNLILLELALKSSEKIDQEVKFPGVIGEIFRHLKKLSSGKYDQIDLDRFEKLSLSHSYGDWSFILTANLKRYSEGKDEESLKVFYDFSETLTTVINPFSDSFKDIDLSFVTSEIGNEWVNYWRDINKGKVLTEKEMEIYDSLKIDEERYIKALADCNFKNKNYESSLYYCEKYTGNDKILKEYFLFRSIRILCYLNRQEEALEIASNKLIDGESVYRVPLEFLIEKCAPVLKKIKNSSVLDLAIIYHHENIRSGRFLQKLSICSYHYFKLNNKEINSNYLDFMQGKKSRYFVREILSEDVLDGFPRFFNDQRKVLTFRIDLLRNLLINLDNNIEDQKEVTSKLSSFSKIYLKELVKGEISSGKIFIGKEKLLSLIAEKIRDDYNVLKKVISADDMIEDFKFSNLKDSDDTAYLLDGNLKLLQLIFLLIRDDYAVHKVYGLDHYLNLNIRHGGMVNHLWMPLKSHALACEFDSNGNYKPIPEWEEHYSLKKNEVLQGLHSQLKKFTISMNDIINEAKSWVHINMGELSDDKKFFNFTFYIDNLEISLENLKNSDSVEKFVLSTFEQLDSMLNDSLDIAKHKILGELKRKVHKCFDDLILNIHNLGFGQDSHIYKVISRSKSEYNVSIDEFSEWFNHKESGNQPLPLSLVIDTVYDNVSNYYPQIKSGFIIKPSGSDALIKARYISYFFDIFNLLANNAFQHSQKTNDLNIIVDIKSGEERINVTFSNNFSKSLSTSLKEVVFDINNVRIKNFEKYAYKDNGSGICKVKKILIKDIGVDSELAVDVNNNMFVVSFSFEHSIISENYD